MSVTNRLIGRTGNSMFQTACIIGYAKKYGYSWGVNPNLRESKIMEWFPNLPVSRSHIDVYSEERHDNKDSWFNYQEIPDLGGDIILQGFWQSWKYFDHCKEDVKSMFKIRQIETDGYPYKYYGWVSIHIRRGDYVQNSGSFPPIGMDYIRKAVLKLRELGLPADHFVVFSDDTQWAKENVISGLPGPHNVCVYPEGLDFDDLTGMANCSHHIIANSTFSWWGAWLGHNENKIIICPSAETWFGPDAGIKHPVKDLLPPDWIQISTR